MHRSGAAVQPLLCLLASWHGTCSARRTNQVSERSVEEHNMSNKVLNLIKENEAKWVDFRFTDTKGKEQHVSYPAYTIDDGTFVDGKMLDGSSIAGWKGIEASDMILLPDDETAFMDPFFDEPTVVVTCDVIEPNTGQGYER